MLGLFSGLKDFVPLGKKIGATKTEGLVAVLHYRFTTLLLLLSCTLVTALEWIGNGRSITCIQEGPDDSWNIPPNVINTYCYIMSTFTLPKQLAGGVIGETVAGPGVGAYNPKTDDVTFKAYYQWVPFVLMLQACLFYAPHLLHKTWEAGKISGIISGLNALMLDRNDRRGKQRVLARYLVENLSSHNIWAFKMLITESIYFLNVFGNIYLMDVFLGGEFRTYGIQVASMMQEDPEDRVDPMARIFPRVTKCTFKKFGPSGTLQTHDSLCVLPVNIINEKIYVFLWFWLLILGVVTFISLIYNCFLFATPSLRNMMLKSRAAQQSSATQALDQVSDRLCVGDWRLLHLLAVNMEPRVFGELMEELADQMMDGPPGAKQLGCEEDQDRRLMTQM